MANVYLLINERVKSYPNNRSAYSPDKQYPEYPWNKSTLSDSPNEVYAMVRECFKLRGYDLDNYGTKAWNPLGDIIKPGNVVLIKPNWVENKNKNTKVDDNLACLVTNPSVIRAILDYVVIALNNSGKIILADAPMQGCDLEEVFRIAGYNELFSFLKENNIVVEIADLRKYSTAKVYKGVLSSPKETKKSIGSVTIELGEKSLHSEKDSMHPDYKVTDYMKEVTAQYHSDGKHIYEVNKLPLTADVIINVPKPKTHRLAGMTAAVKNFVGVTYEKACLPHRIEGDKENSGDAYKKKSVWKERMHYFDEKRTRNSIEGNYFKAKINDIFMKCCYVIAVATGKDKYRIGSWYGNDTIWRTAVDLNYIMYYADVNGIVHAEPQRKILTIGDMVICGQGEGPVGPTPKPLGMIMLSESTLLFDRAMCEIMGFSKENLPMFTDKKAVNHLGFVSIEELENSKLYSNETQCNDICVKDICSSEDWKFEPHSCWKGHIEK